MTSDPCADLPCDTIDNVNRPVVENADAVAFAVSRYAVFAGDIPPR